MLFRSVYYVQGQASTLKINTLAVSGLDVGASGSQVTLTVTATDVFGNKISGKSITAVIANGTLDTTTALTGATLTDFGTRDFKVTMPTTGNTAVIFSVTNASDIATTVTGFNTVTSSVAKQLLSVILLQNLLQKRLDVLLIRLLQTLLLLRLLLI